MTSMRRCWNVFSEEGEKMATGSKVVNGPAQIAKKYNYGDVRIMLENCILPKERLYTTPSMRDGLNKEVEIDLRIVGCEYIQVAGILLRLPQVAMATAQVLFQRFYYSKSFVKHEAEVYAMACIFLAAKIEESPRRIRDVINVFHHIKQRRNTRTIAPMEYLGNSYFVLKNQVIKAERRVLKELGFCVHVKHPHKIIVTYLQILECEKNQSLVQRSWNFMNDSLRTNLFVRYDPEKIACACIFLASRQLNICLPTRPPWWELFNSTRDELEDISVTILELYGRPKAPALDVLQKEVAEIRQKLQEEKDKIKASVGKEKDGTFTPTISPTSTSQQLSRPGSLSGSPTKGSLMAETNGEGQRKKGSGRTGDEKESGAKGSRYEKDSKKVNRSPLVRSRSRSRSHSRSRSRSRTHSRSRSRSRSRGSSYSISISPDSQSLSESESSASDHSPGQRRAERERGRRSPEHRRGGDDRHRHSKYNVSKNDFDRKSHKHKSSAGVSKKSKDRSRDRLRDRSRSPISRSRSRSRERLKDRSRSKHDRDFLKREERKHQRERNSNGADYRSRGKSGRDREHERRRHHR